ncbi:MAG: hypothetical protein ABFC54_02380, partial [Thermoguttaceae bacterium]
SRYATAWASEGTRRQHTVANDKTSFFMIERCLAKTWNVTETKNVITPILSKLPNDATVWGKNFTKIAKMNGNHTKNARF